jgi:hypothetical protein
MLKELIRGNKRKRSESLDKELLTGSFTSGFCLAQDGHQSKRINVLFVGGKGVGQTSLLL